MKTAIFATVAAVLFSGASSVLAADCIPYNDYCGSNLLAMGFTQAQLDAALQGVPEVDGGRNSVFACDGPNQIEFSFTCEKAPCHQYSPGNITCGA
ncbi:hypothetical protein PLICRDRAFT_34180 [Plicaturopsis crispa FD-325 SS-3]|nr:hypothetical protein PLICRDRAFT_34180 [Plicaturopsis crispa FD-325 SS-3]